MIYTGCRRGLKKNEYQSKRASLSICLQFKGTHFTDPLKNFTTQVIHFSHLGEQLIPFDLALCEPMKHVTNEIICMINLISTA